MTAQQSVRHKDAMKDNEGRKSASKPGEGGKKETDDVETAVSQARCVSQQLHIADWWTICFRVVSKEDEMLARIPAVLVSARYRACCRL